MAAVGAALAGHTERAQAGVFRRKPDGRKGTPVIDGHIHLWKLPRNQPPMSDNATYKRLLRQHPMARSGSPDARL